MLDYGVCFATKKGHLQEWNELMTIVHVEGASHITGIGVWL